MVGNVGLEGDPVATAVDPVPNKIDMANTNSNNATAVNVVIGSIASTSAGGAAIAVTGNHEPATVYAANAKDEKVVAINAPQQGRSSRRREALLDAAAEIMAEVGYEAATMTAIASRSKTSIGGLYRYFPDKAAVEHALLYRYEQQAEDRWLPLTREAKELSVRELADRLILQMGEFAVEHPTYLRFGAQAKFAREVVPCRNLRTQFSKTLLQRRSR